MWRPKPGVVASRNHRVLTAIITRAVSASAALTIMLEPRKTVATALLRSSGHESHGQRWPCRSRSGAAFFYHWEQYKKGCQRWRGGGGEREKREGERGRERGREREREERQRHRETRGRGREGGLMIHPGKDTVY